MKQQPDMQKQIQQIASQTRELSQAVSQNRLFDMLEILRDTVRSLSHDHDSIRNDLRDIFTMIGTKGSSGSAL